MKRCLLLLVFVLASCSAARAQVIVPDRVQVITETLAAKNPVLAFGDDDQRRQLTRTIIEQVVFEFPNDQWGWKDAGVGRPPSKDAIARLIGGKLHACDWQNGSTRLPVRPIVCINIDDGVQRFIPIPGVNHLSDTPQPGPTPSPTPDLTPLLTRLDAVEAQAKGFAAELAAQRDALSNFAQTQERIGHALAVLQARPIPVSCRASVFGIGVACTLVF